MGPVTDPLNIRPPRLTFHAVDRRRWRDLETLFESSGGPKHCWCMVWRPIPRAPRPFTGTHRKASLKRLVTKGVPVGLVGYLDGVPVAWVSIAPKPTHRPLRRPDEERGQENVWSLVCFFVRRPLRGQGVMPQLLAAAVAYARTQQATVLEAYPVDPDSPSFRYMGLVPAFAAAGFSEVGRAGTRRHVMRFRLR